MVAPEHNAVRMRWCASARWPWRAALPRFVQKRISPCVVDWATLLNGVVGRMDGMFTGPLRAREVERLLCDGEVSQVVMEDQIVRVFRPDGRELSRHPWAEEFEPHGADIELGTTMRPEPMLV